MGLNWKYESGVDQARNFWRERKERAYHRGLVAADDAFCPYPKTSFAGRHWLRGQKDKNGGHDGNDTLRQD